MSLVSWVVIILLVPFAILVLGLVALFIPDALVTLKHLYEGVIYEWQDLPRRWKGE